MKSNLFTQLSPPLQALLARIATIAEGQQMSLWLVGGVVRDLMLGLPIVRDLDLVIEGNAIILAHAIVDALDGRVVAQYEPFGTATVMVQPIAQSTTDVSQAITLDLATARIETYPSPAALPVVQPATIEQDMARRDFTINAIAIEIIHKGTAIGAGRWLDLFDGQHDVEKQQLRVLHDRSFEDDPTRILRGLRLASRLDFSFEPHTQSLLNKALREERLEAMSADRVRAELCLVLEEPHPDRVLHMADELGITPHVFAPLQWSETLASCCQQVTQEMKGKPHPLLYAGILAYHLSPSEREALIERYRLPGDATRLLQEFACIPDICEKLSREHLLASEIAQSLQPLHDTTLEVMRCVAPARVRTNIARYQTQLRSLIPTLNGSHLQQMGIPPGPQLGYLLKELRIACWDGIVTNQCEEIAWVKQRMKGMKESIAYE